MTGHSIGRFRYNVFTSLPNRNRNFPTKIKFLGFPPVKCFFFLFSISASFSSIYRLTHAPTRLLLLSNIRRLICHLFYSTFMPDFALIESIQMIKVTDTLEFWLTRRDLNIYFFDLKVNK